MNGAARRWRWGRKSEAALPAGACCLADAPAGSRVVVCTVDAGGGATRRLEAMGLLPGTAAEVVSNAGQGPLIVSVRDCRLALGRGLACRIMVNSQREAAADDS